MGRKLRNCKTKGDQTRRKSWWSFKKPTAQATALSNLDFRLEIKEEVLESLRVYAQYEGNEMCGVLTGSQIDDKTFRISKVSPPCVAHNSRCGCERDASKANEFISLDYEESEHTRVYVGEWHTHPERHPSPSNTDNKAIINNFANSDLAFPFLVMIIVGTESLYMSIYDGKGFIQLDLMSWQVKETSD